ncbi:aminopeptidase N [Rhodovulum adriaticum]|uniref:Aminopeptidase N n=1 Tax=Rhodovulum adriaticum TaxID=35804 RepID=A0A4V2SM80_RHOAD|nr:aminopeptidase N [Rhodovulum adriaticum]MBK1636276.1 aminopeptidase N [Rhodovulum adriaticum]TCP26276.1 aminopeptidase N [Rhodovulum adriaticum]
MKDAAPQPVFLRDYTPPAYLVDSVDLTFRLHPTKTRVISRIAFRPNPAAQDRRFFLHGEELTLLRAAIDGTKVTPQTDTEGLTCTVPDAPFTWEAEVEIAPEENTALEGLYMSNGMYCSQCEAEGFRKITYYPDRPDVMAPFTVRIESDLPVLLSNGNPVAQGTGWAEWHDPWPKPAYLFALVAGDLVATSGAFTTCEGRKVDLNIWVRPADHGKADYALDSLIRSMKWDEQVYGRAYDLDVFNIVAVDDFNMGAMENKGLNIFNSRYVLASPQTATDRDYDNIERIIAHEYFHNWTGNRITCRDWFQLCLKEGLTVFRDSQFSADERSAAVKRIEDVIALRARQFREDAGPLAHPVRPESFTEINNFYTATVYEKGAEVIGMLRRLVGPAGYDKALALYFERHDGQAATIEDWLKVFEDATGRDLTQFKRWYSQAGTPRLSVTDDFADGTYTLHLRQETPPTPGQPDKAPQVIPLAVGLLAPNGDEVVPTTVLEMTEAEQSFAFTGLDARPVPSILRGFSAPVVLERETSAQERAVLLAHDTDPFNKWEAGRLLARDVLTAMIRDGAAPDGAFLDALAAVARDATLDPAFRALALRLPGEDQMAEHLHALGHTPGPLTIHTAREALKDALAGHLQTLWPALYDGLACPGPYSPGAADAGRRALRLAALSHMARLDGGAQARAHFAAADNMTDEIGALTALLEIGAGTEELDRFATRWAEDRLVMDKWFALQVSLAAPENAVDTARCLTEHAAFNWKNPNRFRAVIGGLTMNAAGFHDASGAGYRLVADWLLRMDAANPQTAARMSTAFETWPRYDSERQALIRAELDRIATQAGLSRDMGEMVARLRAAGDS